MKLYLGCGPDHKEGFEHRDRQPVYDIAGGWTYEGGLPYSDDSVDCITISHSLMYVEEKDWPFVFKEFWRVLKPRGVVRITEDDVENPGSTYFAKPWPGAKIWTGPAVVFRHLQLAGFTPILQTSRSTMYEDSSILIRLREGQGFVFYAEGVK